MTIADTAWWLDDVSLNTLAYFVRAEGIGEDSPVRRGENPIAPGVSGRRHVNKVFDQRTLSLLMVIDAQATGGGARSGSQLATNLNTIKQLFGGDGTHVLKRTHGGATRLATVEVRQLRIAPGGPNHYNVAAELVFADPFWYAASATTVSDTFASLPDTLAISNAGTYKAEKAVITVEGAITNPRIAIGSSWVQWTGTLNAGDVLVIDCGAFTAIYDPVATDPADAIQDITWADDYVRWLEIPVGTNNATITGTVGGTNPTVTVEFTAPYL